MNLTGKTLIVTGAGGGIGQELVVQLLAKGAQVAAVDISTEALAHTQVRAGVGPERLQTYQLDLTQLTAVAALPAQVAAHFGALDGVLNNAGIIQPFKPVDALTDSEIERVFNVNFFATLHLTRACLPLLRQRPEAYIVNVSSMGGFLAVPGQTIYGAAKAAVKLLSEGLYAELRGTAVRVAVVFPGAVATNITENSGLGKPQPRAAAESKLKPLPPGQAAARIVAGLERNKFRILVGRDARALDLLARLHPRFAIEFVQKQMQRLRGQG